MKYLQQTWHFLAFLCVYLLFVSYALAFPSDTAWTLLLFSTLVVLLEVFSLIGSLQNLEFKASHYLLAHVDEIVPVEITMNKQPKKLLWLMVCKVSSPQYLEDFTYSFYYGQKKSLQITWQPYTRGIVQKQTMHITASDLFSWLKKESTNSFTVHWLVLPAVHPLGKVAANFFQKQLILNKQNFGEPSFKIKKFRPYQSGDRLNQIDWKLSSKQQELVLREYEQEQPIETIFLFYGKNSASFEAMLSLFYSFWQEFQKDKSRFVLLGEQGASSTNLTQEDFSTIQPLNEEVELPDFGKKQIIHFIPEMNQQAEVFSASRWVQVYDYQQLLQQLKE